MANGPGDPATRWNCPSGRGLCADLHNKDEAVLKVAQRALLSEYSPFDAHFPARTSHHTDRLLWVSLYRFWRHWRSTLLIVKPETVVAWHRKGFRLFWSWRVRHGQEGRPAISRQTRDLIRRMCCENLTWGAPRIHGELLKLGIDIGESSVSKYMVRGRKPPSQTWRTFLENHLSQIVSVDFYRSRHPFPGPVRVPGAGS
jgi:putative transposase